MDQVRAFKPVPPDAGIIASSVYQAGRRVADIPIEEAGAWACKDGHVVWIGLSHGACTHRRNLRRALPALQEEWVAVKSGQ